ncbi:hypothetical protein [Nesterenkonia alba]|uniref:hypothetical protein n=1 Tax=Nesterenkonia alba TaxID=515814 RepID=UPI0003B556ED|nr:hypothetical protein [Nesterenkonia alba]
MTRTDRSSEEEVIFGEWRALRTVSSRSLARTRALLEVLEHDPAGFSPAVLGVVGSKGKGTAAVYASATLCGLGLRTGTVMSPGIVSNADRIRVNGTAVSATVWRRALRRLAEARRHLPPATAETGYLAPTGLFMVLAMLIFAEEGVDVVVAEAGMGGVSDDLSHWPLQTVVVTEIFAEHLDVLGPTLRDVARDKAGVIGAGTQWVVSLRQSPQVHREIEHQLDRCTCLGRGPRVIEVATEPTTPAALPEALNTHLPQGIQRSNAAAGVLAALAVAGHDPHHPTLESSGTPATAEASRCGHSLGRSPVLPRLTSTLASVRYPGRLSVHQVPATAPGDPQPWCIVDSAVSRAGLEHALAFSRGQLGSEPDQVLVCLPPGKDLPGFVAGLRHWPGRKVFVELPGAYTGTPDRSAWPEGPGWEWACLKDLGGAAVHEAAGSAQLVQLLSRGDSLAVGTVLFTALVLRTVGAEAETLFTVPPESPVEACSA